MLGTIRLAGEEFSGAETCVTLPEWRRAFPKIAAKFSTPARLSLRNLNDPLP